MDTAMNFASRSHDAVLVAAGRRLLHGENALLLPLVVLTGMGPFDSTLS
jgi:hypothetical protein